jgi:hypothetical protein
MSVEVNDPKEVEGKDRREGRVYSITFRIEGGGSDGGSIRDFFITRSKNDFGLCRLAGVMDAAGVYPHDITKDVEVAWFEGSRNESAIKSRLDSKLVGIVVTQKKGADFPNIVEYLSVKEAQTKLRGNGASGQATPKGVGKDEPQAHPDSPAPSSPDKTQTQPQSTQTSAWD